MEVVFLFLQEQIQCTLFLTFFHHNTAAADVVVVLFKLKMLRVYGNNDTGRMVVYLKNRFHNFEQNTQKTSTVWFLLTVEMTHYTHTHSV